MAIAAMKTLFLLRHAKSSWNDQNLQDFDRPLNARGRKAAELIGTFIKKQKVSPDLVISSPAVRARETIEIIREDREADGRTPLRPTHI